MSVSFIDLATQQTRLRAQIDEALAGVMAHGCYVGGPEIEELERALALRVGVRHAVCCSSGTDALLISLLALDIGRGDGVIVPAFSFIAPAEAAVLAGATPVFADVQKESFLISPTSFERAIETAKKSGIQPRAVIPVDLFGMIADYRSLSDIARHHGVHLIADAAQSFGSERDGKKAGSFGVCAITSFYPAKPLGCYGDGGAIFTDNDSLADKFRAIRQHGAQKNRYQHERIGITGRMDSFQAAILLAKLRIFDEELQTRNEIATRYTEHLREFVATPCLPPRSQSNWACYTIQSSRRDEIRKALSASGLPSAVYYPHALPEQGFYRRFLCAKEGAVVSSSLCRRVLSLPIHPYLSESAQEQIINTIKAVPLSNRKRA